MGEWELGGRDGWGVGIGEGVVEIRGEGWEVSYVACNSLLV
jgi:hypothetical protein